MGLLDLIFPKRCVNCRVLGAYLCSACSSYISFEPERICFMCNKPAWNGLTHPGCHKPQGIDGSFAALSYNGVVKRLLFAYKYRPYVSDLHKLLGELLYEGSIQNEQFMSRAGETTLFIPIPLHSEKMRSRGYNHADLLAREVGVKMNREVLSFVIRTRKTQSQFLLKKEERSENVKNAFALKKGAETLLKDRTIFLVDDVATTGSTLKEVAKVLKKAGAKEVYGLTLAHGH